MIRIDLRDMPADSPLVDDRVPAVNVEPRRSGLTPRLLILHYTGTATAQAAIDWLACQESGVSCHYVIDEAGRITQLVPESLRAWQAGVSVWQGETDINSASIGIEIHNPGHEFGYPAFPAAQMTAVIALSADICARYGIAPRHVLGHSDIAPHRKSDPGERFDWAGLHAAGVGHWVPPVPIAAGDDGAGYKGSGDEGAGLGACGPQVLAVQKGLARYGYGVPVHGLLDAETVAVVRAFQRHFRPARVDGRLDRSTLATLDRLIAALPTG